MKRHGGTAGVDALGAAHNIRMETHPVRVPMNKTNLDDVTPAIAAGTGRDASSRVPCVIRGP
jgi:hypothetical protein